MWQEAAFKALCETSSREKVAMENGDASAEPRRRAAAISIVDHLTSAVLAEMSTWQTQGSFSAMVMGYPAIMIKNLNDIDEIPGVGRYSRLEFYLLNNPGPSPKLAYVKWLHGARSEGMMDTALLQLFRMSVLEGLSESILSSPAVPGPAKAEYRGMRNMADLVVQGYKKW